MSGYKYECGATPPDESILIGGCICSNLAGHTETDHACRCGRIWPVDTTSNKRPEESS